MERLSVSPSLERLINLGLLMENEERKQTPKRVPLPPAAQLDQVDSDLAMAITLQEQERANFELLGTEESENEEEEEEEEDYNDDDDGGEYESDAWDPSNDNNENEYFEGDDFEAEHEFLDEEESNDDEEMEEDEIDPDELSYEELIELGETIGVEKRGLTSNEIDSCLFPNKFLLVESQTGIDRCVICQVEFEKGEDLVGLCPCKHCYHSDCIRNWLQIRKNCPICSTEVTAPKNKNV